MFSSRLAYCTLFGNTFRYRLFRILNSYKFGAAKTKEKFYKMILFFIFFLFKAIFISSITYLCLGNANWTLLVLDITISDYLNLLGYITNIFKYVLNGIRIPRFFGIPIFLSYLSIFSLLFSKKELENTKKQKAFTNKIITISSIIIGILFFINITDLEKLYKRKQHISQLKQVAKFLKNTQNYPIVPLLWLNDNDIIYDAGLGCENESIDQERSYVDININISNCFFKRYSVYSGWGGIIYVDDGSYSMNVNFSMFYRCACSSQGGAISFSSTNSYLRMICAYRCSCGASYGGHFANIYASQINQFEYLSVSSCSDASYGYYSIFTGKGDQRVDNTNSSMNNAKEGSGIRTWYPYSFTSSYCTFSNNKASHSICIYFSSSPETISMLYANIVHNNSPSNGVVYTNGVGPKKMMYCIFNYNQNTLFCVDEGSFEVSHSYIDHSSSSFSTSTTVSILNNNSFINRTTYQLQFFNSHYCNTDIPEKTGGQSQDILSSLLLLIVYSVVVLLFVTLLAYLYFYKRIATNLIASHQLEYTLWLSKV